MHGITALLEVRPTLFLTVLPAIFNCPRETSWSTCCVNNGDGHAWSNGLLHICPADSSRADDREEGEVRLVNQVDVNGYVTGTLQVYVEGAWGAVCTAGFDAPDARVACRQLGFASGLVMPRDNEFDRRQFIPEPVRQPHTQAECQHALSKLNLHSCGMHQGAQGAKVGSTCDLSALLS